MSFIHVTHYTHSRRSITLHLFPKNNNKIKIRSALWFSYKNFVYRVVETIAMNGKSILCVENYKLDKLGFCRASLGP